LFARRLTTKIAIYEENLKRSGGDDEGARYIEMQTTIAQKVDEISALRRRVRSLQAAKRAAEEIGRGRRPRAVATAAGRPVTASGALPRKAWEQVKTWKGHKPEAGRSVPPPRVPDDHGAERAAAAASSGLVAKLRDRLDSLQRRLADKDAEIETLRQQLAEAEAGGAPAGTVVAPSASVDRALRDKEARLIRLQVRPGGPRRAARIAPGAGHPRPAFPRGLDRPRAAPPPSLPRHPRCPATLGSPSPQSRFDQLEAQSAARASLYDKATEALEEQARELREARAAAQAAEAELDGARARALAADRAEAEAREAREEVRRLEAQLEETLSSPFFAEGEGLAALKRRVRELEASERQMRAKGAHLEGTVRGQHADLEALRRERERTSEQLDEAREELAQ